MKFSEKYNIFNNIIIYNFNRRYYVYNYFAWLHSILIEVEYTVEFYIQLLYY
jgi:hypothetical protein